jgi:hypothetical protein
VARSVPGGGAHEDGLCSAVGRSQQSGSCRSGGGSCSVVQDHGPGEACRFTFMTDCAFFTALISHLAGSGMRCSGFRSSSIRALQGVSEAGTPPRFQCDPWRPHATHLLRGLIRVRRLATGPCQLLQRQRLGFLRPRESIEPPARHPAGTHLALSGSDCAAQRQVRPHLVRQ